MIPHVAYRFTFSYVVIDTKGVPIKPLSPRSQHAPQVSLVIIQQCSLVIGEIRNIVMIKDCRSSFPGFKKFVSDIFRMPLDS